MSEPNVLAHIESLLAAVKSGEMSVPAAMAAARQAIDALEISLQPAPKELPDLVGRTYRVAVPEDNPALAGKGFYVRSANEKEVTVSVIDLVTAEAFDERTMPPEWFGTVLEVVDV